MGRSSIVFVTSLVLAGLALAGCSDDPGSSAASVGATSSSSGGGGSGGGDGGQGGGEVACPSTLQIERAGIFEPGGVVNLSATSDLALTSDEVQWTVTAGALSAATGAMIDLTLPANGAIFQAETITATATASRAGCAPVAASADLTFDFSPGQRTLVVYNPSAAGSLNVATAYAAFRAVPDTQLCALDAADTVTLDGALFDAYHAAWLACLDAAGPQIQVVVPVYGVPYKVSNRVTDLADNLTPVTTSLDALLVFGEDAKSIKNAVENPYYRASDSVAGSYEGHLAIGAQRAAHPNDSYYLVARIDGADEAGALALIDRTEAAEALASTASLAGTVYVDGRFGVPHPASDDLGSYEWGEWNIVGVETVFLDAALYPVVSDYNDAELGTAPAPLSAPDALYYAGWYSFGNYNDAFTWAPGAIGGHLDSCSACDIRGAKDWSAVALRKGITATFGAVNEPYVVGMPDYDELFYLLLQGASFGEAAYESTYVGAWMMVYIGDPWYRPYGR